MKRVRFSHRIACLFFTLALANFICAAPAGTRVSFDNEGIVLVDGKPFFPIGIFTYELTPAVLAELHELQFNTVLNGFATNQLDLLHEHGLMAVCHASPEWINAAMNHPALFAWYLSDEPENRSTSAEKERKRYLELKSKDPNHPIGLCHTSFEALTTFKSACDVTMTDIYPITPERDKNIMGVSIMMDEARRIHGASWPQWTYIQTFGGPEADNGVWAVPLPHEVRFMVYQALVHRATGILYFSYWPKQPRTWESIATINKEIHTLIPRLVAPGREGMLKSGNTNIQARVRSTSRNSGVIIAINTSPKFVQSEMQLEDAPSELNLPFEARTAKPSAKGALTERFSSYGVHVYTWGTEPIVNLARENSH